MVLQISTLDSVLSHRSVDGEPIFADALNKIRIRIVVGVLLTVLKGTQKSILPSPFQWQREFFFLLRSLRYRLLYLTNWVVWNYFNKDLTLIYFIIVTFPSLFTEPLNKAAQTIQHWAVPAAKPHQQLQTCFNFKVRNRSPHLTYITADPCFIVASSTCSFS